MRGYWDNLIVWSEVDFYYVNPEEQTLQNGQGKLGS
jgi:hypothetical protein